MTIFGYTWDEIKRAQRIWTETCSFSTSRWGVNHIASDSFGPISPNMEYSLLDGGSMKRLRAPRLKDGELRVYWGREPHDQTPDVMFAWQGDRMMKRDSNLLHHHLASRHPDPFAKPVFSKMNPSLIEELKARGYDITTLRFSIMKKKVEAA